jgi:hypothetical protein
VLVQWAVSWASVNEMAGQSVSQIMGTRVRDGNQEFLVNWSCSWIDIGDELMKGDLWQPFLDQEAKDEADEADEAPSPEELEKVKATKRSLNSVAVGTRRSLRGKVTHEIA